VPVSGVIGVSADGYDDDELDGFHVVDEQYDDQLDDDDDGAEFDDELDGLDDDDIFHPYEHYNAGDDGDDCRACGGRLVARRERAGGGDG